MFFLWLRDTQKTKTLNCIKTPCKIGNFLVLILAHSMGTLCRLIVKGQFLVSSKSFHDLAFNKDPPKWYKLTVSLIVWFLAS